ncbi:hypothetical protein HK100_010739 [Physocladia obscura]|uniref:Uncharacterized protein n=1 Tax=Physocladia obscura TaxID=109957 RepID=A0AAD5SNS5_9FUNG|nr:hypothetical protein HK100_010739 [Physocladia obscura]
MKASAPVETSIEKQEESSSTSTNNESVDNKRASLRRVPNFIIGTEGLERVVFVVETETERGDKSQNETH